METEQGKQPTVHSMLSKSEHWRAILVLVKSVIRVMTMVYGFIERTLGVTLYCLYDQLGWGGQLP